MCNSVFISFLFESLQPAIHFLKFISSYLILPHHGPCITFMWLWSSCKCFMNGNHYRKFRLWYPGFLLQLGNRGCTDLFTDCDSLSPFIVSVMLLLFFIRTNYPHLYLHLKHFYNYCV
jgi:hypothetical protein